MVLKLVEKRPPARRFSLSKAPSPENHHVPPPKLSLLLAAGVYRLSPVERRHLFSGSSKVRLRSSKLPSSQVSRVTFRWSTGGAPLLW